MRLCGSLATIPRLSKDRVPGEITICGWGTCSLRMNLHRNAGNVNQIRTEWGVSYSMASMGADVAVVIVTYNSSHVIGPLLDSLPDALDGLSADVVVVDNGSDDDTVAVVHGREDCRLIQSANLGYSAGINRGVRDAAPADAILVLNPDVLLEPYSVRRMVEALQEPNTGVVAPQVRMPDGSLDLSLRREPSLLRALGLGRTKIPWFSECVNNASSYREPHTVDWALGAILVISRACYDAVGGWDESFFLYSEETQFSLDAWRLGYATRYVPSAVVTHIGGQSGITATTYSMMVINRVRIYRRRHGASASWCYYGLAILTEVVRIVRGRTQSWFAILALLQPSRRPSQLNCSTGLMPR